MLLIFVCAIFLSYVLMRWRMSTFLKESKPVALPTSYGTATVIIQIVCTFMASIVSLFISQTYSTFLIFLVFLLSTIITFVKFTPHFHARKWVEKCIKLLLLSLSSVAILITLSIALTLITQAFRFFRRVPFSDFLLGLQWSPTTGFYEAGGNFGVLPLLTGTALTTCIALVVAVPIGLLTAIYLSQYATRRQRHIMKPLLEILAAVPSIVYGFFAMMLFSPALAFFFKSMGFSTVSENALGAGFMLGIMIVPYMSALSEDILRSVPRHLKNASLAMGATAAETIRHIILPVSFPGLMSAFLLSVARAIGETMLVVMALGLTPKMSFNPLETTTTVTVQIVSLLTGDQDFNSAASLSAFALGLLLFLITLFLNSIALHVVRKQQKRYEY